MSEGRWRTIRGYGKSHLRGITVFVVLCAAAAIIISLYRLPVAAVGYITVVCGVIGLLFLAYDYLQFEKKCQRMESLKKEILTTVDELPEPENTLEEKYQDLLQLLYEEKERLCVETEKRYSDLVEYYSMWAHQIKTPIAAAGLIIQSAEQQETEAAGEIRALKEELQRIEQYTEMVMCYLRLDAGSTDYVIREYDLDTIIRQAVRKHAAVFIRKKLKLVYEPLQTRVVTDEKWLLFVIEQLISNALKYTAEGSVTITLEEPKTLCIRDTGIGIAAEDLPRIFEKGYTGCNGRADKKASGIGLYLCRRICRNLCHTISADSQPGVGTVIRLDLKNAELEIE